MVRGTSKTSASLSIPELTEWRLPLEATEAVSLLPVSIPLSLLFCRIDSFFDMSMATWPASVSSAVFEDKLRTRSSFSFRRAMKCFISGRYSVILPWPLWMEADKGLLGAEILAFFSVEFDSAIDGMRPQSLYRLFTASMGFNEVNFPSGNFFKATRNC